MTGHQRQNIDNLKKRIKAVLTKERVIRFSAGLLATVAILIAVSLILSFLAGIFIIPVWVKIGLLILSAGVTLYFFWRLALSRLLAGDNKSAALKLEKKFPLLKGRLIAALQFSNTENNIPGYSNDLIDATLKQAVERSSNLNFNQVVSAYPLWRSLRPLVLGLVVAITLLVLFPGLFTYSYHVYSHPNELIAPPLGYKLSGYPGSTMAIKYRDVDLGGILQGETFPEKATVYYRFAGGIWQKTPLDLTERPTVPSAYGDSLLFYTTLKQVRRSLDYYVKAGRITTPVYHLDVVDRPRVTGIKLSLFYPDYTGLKPLVIEENDGSISAVVGSRVNMRLESNVLLEKAEMLFDDSSRSPFELNGQVGELSFRISEDKNYMIHLVDKQGETNPDPIEYYITAVPDEYPVIDVKRPGIDINLNDDMIVPLHIGISDDYGFSSLVLKYRHVSAGESGEENIAVLHFSDNIKTEGDITLNWDVEPLMMMPSDYIRYYFELADNDNISGPKVSKSREYIARLPSLEEIIAQTEAEHGQNISRAEQFLKSNQELSERMNNIIRKIEQDKGKADQKLNWQHQKELEEIARQDEKLAEQIKDASKKMDDFVKKMEQERLTSRELLEKLTEIQKLFEEVATPEMRESRLKLMEALKKMDQKELDEALKDFQMSQEDLMKRLNRTVALLKKMQIEQKVNAMTEMARQLSEQQDQMNSKTSESEPNKLPALSPAERKVKKGLDQLRDEASKLRKMLSETEYEKQSDANKFCQSVEQCRAGENMKRMSDKLDSKEKAPAEKEGKKALSRLLQLLDDMQDGQASMCKGGGEDMAGKMRDAIDDINYLSDKQEKLINLTAGIKGRSDVLRDVAAEQQILRESVGGLAIRIEELGMQSPFVAAELNNLVQTAIGNIDLSIDQLSERRGREAAAFQSEALYNLNRTAVRMLDALNSQNNCNKGGSCNKPSMKLNSMCNQQKKLNQQTQNQCNNPQPNPGGQKTAMQRLAAEQGAIGKSLRELESEFGNSREILGRLDAIADDMEKVADQLSEGQVGQETIDRQLKILSRMLDADRTMQRKDFTEQRKAAVGLDVLRNSPAVLTTDQMQGGINIEDKLRRFMQEGYPPEYEQHIKAYFKALLEQNDIRPESQ